MWLPFLLEYLTFPDSLIYSYSSFRAFWKATHLLYETSLMKPFPIYEPLSFLHNSCPFHEFAYCMSQTEILFVDLSSLLYSKLFQDRHRISSCYSHAPCVPSVSRVVPRTESMSNLYIQLNLKDRKRYRRVCLNSEIYSYNFFRHYDQLVF